MEKDGLHPLMPPCSSDHHIAVLMELGPVEVAGMDRVPIGWTTMANYVELSGTPLQPWECRMLRHLSAAWLAANREGEKHDAVPPWNAATEETRAQVDRLTRDVFQTFMIRQEAARARR